MHHSENVPESESMRRLRELLPTAPTMQERMAEIAKQMELGATQKFPQGQLDPTDEGEIKIAVGVQDGKVIINFGKPVAWIGFDSKQARQLAESIRKASYQA